MKQYRASLLPQIRLGTFIVLFGTVLGSYGGSYGATAAELVLRYRTFKMVEYIRTIAAYAAEICEKERKDEAVRITCATASFNHKQGQTKSGLYLLIAQSPWALDTPWGRMILYTQCSESIDVRYRLTLKFLESLDVSFCSSDGDLSEPPGPATRFPCIQFYEVCKAPYGFMATKTCKKNLKNYVGTNTFLTTNLSDFSFTYKVLRTDECDAASAKYRSKDSYRNSDQLKSEVEKFAEIYKAAQSP